MCCASEHEKAFLRGRKRQSTDASRTHALLSTDLDVQQYSGFNENICCESSGGWIGGHVGMEGWWGDCSGKRRKEKGYCFSDFRALSVALQMLTVILGGMINFIRTRTRPTPFRKANARKVVHERDFWKTQQLIKQVQKCI